MKGFRFLGVGGNRSARRKPTKAGMNRKTKFKNNHWLAALVKEKCSSTKPTRLTTGVVCHPDSEQNRPYKISWPCRELNRGPTAPQARTLPVCHTTTNIYKPLSTAGCNIDPWLQTNIIRSSNSLSFSGE